MKIFYLFLFLLVNLRKFKSKKRKLVQNFPILPFSLVFGGYYATNRDNVNRMANNFYM